MPVLQSHTILNVDDSEAGRYAKSRILQRAGFRVIEAATGEAALQSIREERPELVLLDIKLPDISGVEVCRIEYNVIRNWVNSGWKGINADTNDVLIGNTISLLR